MNSLELNTPLDPRDSLYGGRTNALKLYHKCTSNEKIKYIDYTSLYPYIQKYGIYPIGHPEIITENIDYGTSYFGIIKCRILPPRGLYIPVLPLRVNNKLLFPLCGTCASEQSSRCDHNEQERMLEGTWCTLETDEALKHGYKMVKIFEVWHWKESAQYDAQTHSGGIFDSYVNQAMKEKQEASGFPDNVQTEEEKDAYIKEYYDYEGISFNILILQKLV